MRAGKKDREMRKGSWKRYSYRHIAAGRCGRAGARCADRCCGAEVLLETSSSAGVMQLDGTGLIVLAPLPEHSNRCSSRLAHIDIRPRASEPIYQSAGVRPGFPWQTLLLPSHPTFRRLDVHGVRLHQQSFQTPRDGAFPHFAAAYHGHDGLRAPKACHHPTTTSS